MLDNRVAFVARHHADVEETPVFGMAHRLEGALAGVAVVLWRLHDAGPLRGEGRHEIAQPARVDHVVGVDHRDHLRPRIRLAKREVERAGLESRQSLEVKETEA